MKKFKHLSMDEKAILQDLLLSDLFKKKNGQPNLSKIAKYMKRSKNTISLEIKKFRNFKQYDAVLSQKIYLKKERNVKSILL